MMWFIAMAMVLGHAATVERPVIPPVVRREAKGNVASQGPAEPSSPEKNPTPAAVVPAPRPVAAEAKRGPKVHITRIHPAEVEAWNFLEVDQTHRSVGAQPSEDEADPSEDDEEEAGEAAEAAEAGASSPSRADEEIEEAQDPADPEGEDSEDLNEELQLASLLSKPLGEEQGRDQKPFKQMEKEGKNHKKLMENATSVGKKPLESGAKIEHKKGDKKLEKNERPSEDEDSKGGESLPEPRNQENSTSKTYSTSNESHLTRADTSQNMSHKSKNDTEQNSALTSETSRKNSSEMSQPGDEAPEAADTSEERNASVQFRSKNESVIDGAEKELRKIQDALRNAEQRAAKAEAELKAEKAWVANALSNHSGEDAIEHHKEAVEHQKDVQRVRHEAALADLADVLMKLESNKDPHKPVQHQGKNEEIQATDADDGSETDELSKGKHRKKRSMRHSQSKTSEESEEDTDADEDDDVNSAVEESGEEVPQTQKHKTAHKHKSHKHKKGGFHVYVEADGGVLEH